MRRFRAFLFLAGRQLKQPWFWVFLILFALMGPVFVVLHSETDLAERELRPLLSKRAAVAHFDTRRFSPVDGIDRESIMLFREPTSDSALSSPLGFLYSSGNQLAWIQGGYSPSVPFSLSNGNLSGFHTYLFPILMTLAGVMAVPSRRRLVVLRATLPCSRLGCFLIIVGVLILRLVLLGAIAGATTLGTLALVHEVSARGSWFVIEHFSSLIVYGLGFAMLGIVIAEIVRTKPIALLAGIVFLIAVWPFLMQTQTALSTPLRQSSRDAAVGEVGQNPLVSAIVWIVSVPPEVNFDSLRRNALIRSTWTDDPYQNRSNIQQNSLYKWSSLIVFATFWFAIGWLSFPRVVRALE